MTGFSSQLRIKEGRNDAKWADTMFHYIKKFSVFSLTDNQSIELMTAKDEEAGVVILDGMCDIVLEGKEHKNLGTRKSVFEGIPTAVYIPVGTNLKVTGTEVTFALCVGKCSQKTHSAIIRPEDIKVMQAGKDNWHREVRMIIGPDSPAQNLLIGETLNPPGNWSGTPPHKHEHNNLPGESLHEELYYFKTDKPQGYGIEKFYSPEHNIDMLIPIKDGTVTYMPYGYHQIVAAPGYTLYYLFFLSGEGKKLVGIPDKDHAWITK